MLLGDRRFEAQLLDISLKGALIHTPPEWNGKVGEPCVMQLRLDPSTETIAMDMEVRRADGERLGLHCRMIDVESLTHLRRLLELNFGDPALVERELGLLG